MSSLYPDKLKRVGLICMLVATVLLSSGCCKYVPVEDRSGSVPSADEILGNPAYPAISYSGWRTTKRADELAPTVDGIKEDLRLMHAAGIRVIRTYNTQLYPQTGRILEAIDELRAADPGFEMYVMLGAWIQCEGAYDGVSNHQVEDADLNLREINRAIEMAQAYPEIIRIIAVGNEATVTWQPHHVSPAVILKWVNVLKTAREDGRLASDLWITTSDNWAALGGEASYHNDDLLDLLRAIDYVSLHTYAFHDTYYYPTLDWAVEADASLPLAEQRAHAVQRAVDHQRNQVAATRAYMTANGIDNEIHIGETGWASRDDSHYGPDGTAAADEYTMKLFHDTFLDWCVSENISCFYFQAFDEPWKSSTPDGSESHFGLFTVDGQAKFVIWDLVDSGRFNGLGRDGKPVTKTFDGDSERLMETVRAPVIHKFRP